MTQALLPPEQVTPTSFGRIFGVASTCGHGPGTTPHARRCHGMANRQGTRRDALLAQQAVLAEFGEFALRADELDPILNEACRLAPGRSAPTSPRSCSGRPTAAPCSSAPASAGSPAWSAG